jgi:nucleotide-binding universal stress UspA family protein
VHAWSWFPTALRRADSEAGAPADPEQITAEADRALTAALEEWRDKYPQVRAGTDVIRGHPGRVLASHSARADLVVLGRHPGLGRAAPGSLGNVSPGVGSILHAVLDHAHGPVAVVPSATADSRWLRGHRPEPTQARKGDRR